MSNIYNGGREKSNGDGSGRSDSVAVVKAADLEDENLKCK